MKYQVMTFILVLYINLCMSQKNNEQIQKDTIINNKKTQIFSNNVGCVIVETDSTVSIGSATVFFEKYAISTHHGLENYLHKKISIIFDDEIIQGTVVKQNHEKDLSLIVLEERPKKAIYLPVADIQKETKAKIVGYPRGVAIQKEISDLEVCNHIQPNIINTKVDIGYSGGAVFDQEGHILGMIISSVFSGYEKIKDGCLAGNEFSLYVPIDTIHKLMFDHEEEIDLATNIVVKN